MSGLGGAGVGVSEGAVVGDGDTLNVWADTLATANIANINKVRKPTKMDIFRMFTLN